MADNSSSSDLPEEVYDSLHDLDASLTDVEDKLRPLTKVKLQDLKSKLQPLEAAKADLVMTYAMNSLFWTYLVTQGIDPKDHPVKQELDRIRKYMQKVKELEDRENAARLDKAAAKRFVAHALAGNKSDDEMDTTTGVDVSGSKRKSDSGHEKPKKKKKHKAKQE